MLSWALNAQAASGTCPVATMALSTTMAMVKTSWNSAFDWIAGCAHRNNQGQHRQNGNHMKII
jgi:hypothetical protein